MGTCADFEEATNQKNGQEDSCRKLQGNPCNLRGQGSRLVVSQRNIVCADQVRIPRVSCASKGNSQ